MSSNQMASTGAGTNTDRNQVATSFFGFRVPRLGWGISRPRRRGVRSLRPPSSRDQSGATSPQMPLDSKTVTKIASPGEQAAYMVTIPGGVGGGQQFPVTIDGQHLLVTCPSPARPGMRVRITPPAPPAVVSISGGSATCRVPVPSTVRPGECFEIFPRGKRVQVRCPSTSKPGQILQIIFPIDESESPAKSPAIPSDEIKLDYSKDGWARTIRRRDMKFQWERVDEGVGMAKSASAFVLKVNFLYDNIRARQGLLSLVAADEGIVYSTITNSYGQELFGCSDVARIQAGSFRDKIESFQDVCNTKLAVGAADWRRHGFLRINVRRQHLLSDSMEAVMSLSQNDLRKGWRIGFIGEADIDDGGYSRDWFGLVTEQVFDPGLGLWRKNAKNQKCMEINPASETAFHGDHLIYFRFLGRVMGKALLCQQLIKGRMLECLYKFILGWPITVKDLELIDEDCYHCLNELKGIIKGLEKMNMTVDLMHEVLGFVVGPCGAQASLAEGNLEEYTKAVLNYRLLKDCEAQLAGLLVGIYDAVPAPLLAAFDYCELEQLLCGSNKADLTTLSWNNSCVD